MPFGRLPTNAVNGGSVGKGRFLPPLSSLKQKAKLSNISKYQKFGKEGKVM